MVFPANPLLERAQLGRDAVRVDRQRDGTLLASRPAGSKLLAAAKKSKAVVVVAKLDRLFRSVADAASVIDEFDKKGIQLVAISESFDMTSPFGRAMAQMASVFAELERAMIRERTRSAGECRQTEDHCEDAADAGRGDVISRHRSSVGLDSHHGEDHPSQERRVDRGRSPTSRRSRPGWPVAKRKKTRREPGPFAATVDGWLFLSQPELAPFGFHEPGILFLGVYLPQDC
jgi:hypothetical protein